MLSHANFTLTQLQYVMAVHRYGHFAKAAQSCHVTQPTLSMQIQKLEEELGVIIFDRGKKPILLSAIGKKLIEQIQTVLFEAKKIEALVKASQNDQVTGDLNLGVIPTIAPYLLPLLLPVLETDFPELSLKMYEMQTHRILEALDADEIDVGIMATPVQDSKMFEYPLYYEPFSVLCGKNHDLSHFKRVKTSHLKADDIWLLEEGHCLRHQVVDLCSIKQNKGPAKALNKPSSKVPSKAPSKAPSKVPSKSRSQGMDPKPKRRFQFESGSLETLKNLVDQYGGYTLLPELATERYGVDSVLVPFDRPVPAREVGLVYRREHYKGELIESLGASILKAIPESVSKLRRRDLDVLPL